MSSTSTTTILAKTWQSLTRPSDALTDPIMRQNARFFASWVVIGIPIAVVVSIWLPIIEGDLMTHPVWLIGLNLLGILTYLLARSRHYQWGCILEILSMWAGSTIMALTLPYQGHSLSFLIVPVLLSATVLSFRFTLITAILSIITVPAISPFLPTPDYHGILHAGLTLLAGNVFILTARLHQERLVEQNAQALLDREVRHRRLLEAAYDGTAIIKDGRIAEASTGFSKVFSRSPEDLLRARLVELVTPECSRLVEASLKESPSRTIEVTVIVEDKRAWVEMVCQVHTDLEGAEISLVAVRDVTERHNIHNQLLFADRMMSMGTLAAGVAHEINNPLTYILASQRSLATDIPPMLRHIDPSMLGMVQKRMDLMGEGLDRVRQIVMDLATFSRIDDSQPCCVDVHMVVDSAVNMAWNEIRHRAQLIKEYDTVPPIGVNDAKLVQILLNLLINAAQALPDGQAETMYIRLHTGTHESGDAIIQVEDTGHGIPTEISDRVLEPFFTTKPIGQGTGLGLSVCHFIVENAGGSLTLESTDSGTTVTIRLPAASHLAEDIPIPEFDPIDPSHEQIRVLVVDDEPAIAHLLSDMLEDYSVVAMSSGSEAISLMETKQFDVLVCDLMMPDVSGIDVYHFLQSRGEQDRVIFLTGGAFSPASRNFLSNISNLVIRKPFIRDQIRRAVANLNQKTESIPLKAG